MEPITLFSWGYWGWGSTTRELIRAVDAVEHDRGFVPPLFVDIRISRSVRAVGFRDRAFEEAVGKNRYRWMRELGNRHVETRTGPRIQIAQPSAAKDLLDLALAEAEHSRRILFFCSCESPINDHDEDCHRVTVTRLLHDAAHARGVGMRVVEWPGGEPASIELSVPPAIFRAVKRGARTFIPVAKPVPLAAYAGLAWGSLLSLQSEDEELRIVTGPARVQAGEWRLPVIEVFPGSKETDARSFAERFRRERGYQPLEVAVNAPPRTPPAAGGHLSTGVD